MHSGQVACHACVLSRRTVLAGAAAGAAVAVSGCTSRGNPATAGAPGQVVAQVADVPVGGGTILGDRGIVLTQPKHGTIKAFSATCTHLGCRVSTVDGDTIRCSCHGSAFHIADGAVARGPASRPLAPVAITVDGAAIKLA